MTEKRRPWGKWFWGDWRKDARLRRVSYAARGLWADMLSLMGGECDRFGYLLMEGQALQPADLAGLLGGSEREVSKMLGELEAKRVFSRTGDENLDDDIKAIVAADLPVGVIFSRRMLRDKAKEEFDRANGKGGGNPSLKGSEKNTPLPLNGGVNPPDKAQSQKPESETRKDTSLRSVSPPSAETPPKRAVRSVPKAEPPGFSEWYQAFPLHKARPAAAKAYAGALTRASPEELLAGAKRYALERNGEEPRFTAHPATWLSQNRWQDEPTKGPRNGTGNSNGSRKSPAATSHQKMLEGAVLFALDEDGGQEDLSGRGRPALEIVGSGRS